MDEHSFPPDVKQIEGLLGRIALFLAAPVVSDGGGWAPVSEQDYQSLWQLVEDLISRKWARDCDGDLPIEINLVDRTQYEGIHIWRYHTPTTLRHWRMQLDT